MNDLGLTLVWLAIQVDRMDGPNAGRQGRSCRRVGP